MLITLTTDFGITDSFVGIMKGVIAQINPRAAVVDLTHGIPPQNILAAAMTLSHAVKYFPQQSIHVMVVDPGVGSTRRPLLVTVGETHFIGPDNGVLSLAWQGRQPNHIIHLSNPAYHLKPTSRTFHGRDIFAPVAAYLSLGIAPEAFGETLEDYLQISWPKVIRSERSVTGEIVYIDGFGNVFTSIQEQDLTGLGQENLTIVLGELAIRGLAPNYCAVESGQPVALINSWGVLEIAINRGNVARRFNVRIGEKVRVSTCAKTDGGHRL
jgi:S-adenosyl-L-methionine hydrolase (adenosine-forming)